MKRLAVVEVVTGVVQNVILVENTDVAEIIPPQGCFLVEDVDCLASPGDNYNKDTGVYTRTIAEAFNGILS